jgi:hypothetical protein
MPLASALVLATTIGLAGAQNNPAPGDEAPPHADEAPPQPDSARDHSVISQRARDNWMLSLEAVTRVPLEAGMQAGVETPFGLRLFAGYGWVPSAYIGLVAGVAGGAEASVILDSAQYSGDSARIGVGIRPFRALGAYLDVSYAHVRLDATRDIPAFSVPGFSFPGGTYALHTGFDLWSVELGYEAELARRFVLAGALGLTGALQSNTVIRPRGGAPDEEPALSQASADIDHVFRTNVMPTLTLRLGFDLI